MKKFIFILNLLFVSNVYSADLNLDPEYLKLTIYKFSVSTSPLCTSPVTVFENSSGVEANVLESPDFGDGFLADGTYSCVIIEFSDNIKYTPTASSDSGGCVAGTEYTLDVCNASGGGSVTMTDGTTTTCDDTNQRITMYLSTASTSSGGSANAFTPPTSLSDASNGFNLASALVVSGKTSGKFVVNGTDKVCDTNDGSCSGVGTCEMMPPAFSFAKL